MARKGGSWTEQGDGSLKENKPDGTIGKSKPAKIKESKKDKAKSGPELESDKE